METCSVEIHNPGNRADLSSSLSEGKTKCRGSVKHWLHYLEIMYYRTSLTFCAPEIDKINSIKYCKIGSELLQQKMSDEECFQVLRKLTNPEAEGMADITARTIASLGSQERSDIQLQRVSIIREMVSLETSSPSCTDDARKNISGSPTTQCFPGWPTRLP